MLSEEDPYRQAYKPSPLLKYTFYNISALIERPFLRFSQWERRTIELFLQGQAKPARVIIAGIK